MIFEGFPTKSGIPCIFQALGPIPLDPERISDQFWYWKCSDSSEENKRIFVNLTLKFQELLKRNQGPSDLILI